MIEPANVVPLAGPSLYRIPVQTMYCDNAIHIRIIRVRCLRATSVVFSETYTYSISGSTPLGRYISRIP